MMNHLQGSTSGSETAECNKAGVVKFSMFGGWDERNSLFGQQLGFGRYKLNALTNHDSRGTGVAFLLAQSESLRIRTRFGGGQDITLHRLIVRNGTNVQWV